MKLLISSLLALSTCFSATSLAGDFYYGGSVTTTKYEDPSLGEKANINLISGRLGYQFNDYFAAETRLGFGLGEDEIESQGLIESISHQGYLGLYAKAGFPITQTIQPYVIAGYAFNKVKGQVLTQSGPAVTMNLQDASFGVGVDFKFDGFDINAEYLQYLDRAEAKVDGVSIGISTTF